MRSQAEARAVTILAVRLGGILLITLVMWVVLSAGAGATGFPPNSLWATLGLLPVNIVCLLLMRRWHRAEGRTLQEALGIRRGNIGRDVLWGLLWLVVLNVPFALAIGGTVFALYGAQAPEAFETIFVNPEAETPLGPGVLLFLAVISVIPFMIINAPTEELVYRGHGLAGLGERFGTVGPIAVTSVLFGLQHTLFAATVPGMLVFFVAFTLWGVLAAIIVSIQRRLFPVVVAHWVINFLMSSPALLVPALQLAGVLPG